MRATTALVALALILPLAACSNSRDAMGSRNKDAVSRSFDASYSAAVGDTPGTRGGAMGGTLSGTLAMGDLQLDDGSYVDVYGVNLNAGDMLTVDMTSMEFDTYLVILAPDGQGFENDDFNGDLTHSRLSMPAGQTGPYAILATSYEPGATGNYSVSVEAPAEVVVVPPESLR
jgi:hypothetical protein